MNRFDCNVCFDSSAQRQSSIVVFCIKVSIEENTYAKLKKQNLHNFSISSELKPFGTIVTKF